MLKNPISLWIKRTLSNKIIEIKNKSKSLKLGYMAIVKNCCFGNKNVIGDYVSMTNVSMDDMSYVVSGTSMKNTIIGKYCSIGPGCTIGLGKHPSSQFVSSHPMFFSTLKQAQQTFVCECYYEEFNDIKIGNDVWIGANVTIVDGVKIADGVIVAAGAVVVKDVPPYAIIGGVPAKVLKYRFKKDQIEYLLDLKWWDKDLAWLQKHHKEFLNIDDLMSSISCA